MFDILTAVVLVLSGMFEGWKLVQAVTALGVYNENAGIIPSAQLEVLKNNCVIEIVVCGILLALTLVCIIRFIRLAIIGNIIYLTRNTTKDFIRTTNGTSSGKQNTSHRPKNTGGMRITNSDENDK